MDNIYGVTLNEAFTADLLDGTCTININLWIVSFVSISFAYLNTYQ